MRILLVRHGRSEGNVDKKAYIEKGDQNVALTELGWCQAIRAGDFLGHFYQGKKTWPRVFLSSYQRTQGTLAGVLHGMNGAIPGQPEVLADPRLVEKHFGATSILDYPDGIVDPDWAAEFKKVSNATYQRDPYTTPNPFGESSKANLIAVKSFLDGTFLRDTERGHDDFLFIVHGAVIREFLMCWRHLPIQSRSAVPSPGNCDIIQIKGKRRNWDIRKIYDGEKGQAVDAEILKDIQPYSVEDLPPVPEHLRDDLRPEL